MTREQVYDIWRPENSPWSCWVKPVLFSFLSDEQLRSEPHPRWQEWRVPPAADNAIILELPGAEGVDLGIALCRAGHRPVPVYNAAPFAADDITSLARPVPAAVDLLPVMSALCGRAQELASVALAPTAPPVFLLNSLRCPNATPSGPLWFDNRSFVSETDFPSASFFRQHGIRQVVLVQAPSDPVQADLRQILLGLQRDGMRIARQAPWEGWDPQPFSVKTTPVFSAAWEFLKRKFFFQKSRSSVFGGIIHGGGG